MNNLASTYRNQGRWKEAEDLFVQVMETRKRVLGAEHPDRLTSMSNLAFTWHSLDRTEEAISLMDECVRGRTSRLGLGHSLVVSPMSAVASWHTERLSRRTTQNRLDQISFDESWSEKGASLTSNSAMESDHLEQIWSR
ncbi:kinesin light chain [Zalerion maritima]|uniref:Kinesin light chain n=1 Tax=Zalerion maritima TaxID=339359 RepID=A0AAD5WLY9_9PEZI|nr:kinesin light chain [Zalerion maritima]